MSGKRKAAVDHGVDEDTSDFVRTMAAVLLTGIGAALSYWMWPEEVMDLPWAELRVRHWLRAAASVASPLVFLGMALSLWRE